MYEEILRELKLCRESLIAIRVAITVDSKFGRERKAKSSLMYMRGYAPILHVFSIKHILASEIDLISIANPSKLKWDAGTQHKGLTTYRLSLLGQPKQDCGPRADDRRIALRVLVGEGKCGDDQSKKRSL